MTMKTQVRVLEALVAGVLLIGAAAGCDLHLGDSTGPSQTVTVTQGQQQGQPSPSPSPSASACPKVEGAVLSGPDLMRVGESAVLDISPQTIAPNSSACDSARKVTSSVVGPCSLSGSRPYNQNLTALAVGVCKVSATVDGVASNEIAVKVQ